MNGTSVERLAAVLMVAAAVGCGGDGRGAATPPPPANMPAWQGGYRLPVHGKWKVHRTHYRNKRDQSSGVDLVKLGRVTDKKRNEGFPSYGQPIVADAPGIVAIAVDGIPDNTPGVVNKYDQHGNYVVLDHRNGEFSLFAHFIPGSVRVRAGQAVAMGEELGKCGNSGASTMPHLHMLSS